MRNYRNIRNTAASAVLWVCVASAANAGDDRANALLLAAVANDVVYTAYRDKERGWTRIDLEPMGGTWPKKVGESRYTIVASDDPAQMIRWKYINDLMWVSSDDLSSYCETARIPPLDLVFFDRNNPKSQDVYRGKYPDSKLEASHIWRFTKALNLAQGIWLDRGEWLNPDPAHKPITEAYCDFLPTSASAGLLFVVRKEECEIWKAGFTWEKRAVRQHRCWEEEKLPEKPVEEIEAPTRFLVKKAFLSPFMVLERNSNYYFLTKDGKIFVAAKPKEGKRKAEVFWFNVDNPVFALITDAATGRMFAFSRPVAKKETEKPVVFELTGDKPEKSAFDLERFNRIDAKSRIKQARELVQLLVDDKNIELKSPKSK